MQKQVALYARVSSDRQVEEGTIDSQLASLQTYSDDHRYTIDADMIFIDDEAKPVIVGTGSEDYFNGAWKPDRPSVQGRIEQGQLGGPAEKMARQRGAVMNPGWTWQSRHAETMEGLRDCPTSQFLG